MRSGVAVVCWAVVVLAVWVAVCAWFLGGSP